MGRGSFSENECEDGEGSMRPKFRAAEKDLADKVTESLSRRLACSEPIGLQHFLVNTGASSANEKYSQAVLDAWWPELNVSTEENIDYPDSDPFELDEKDKAAKWSVAHAESWVFQQLKVAPECLQITKTR